MVKNFVTNTSFAQNGNASNTSAVKAFTLSNLF
jgi:hypothetical protein